MVCRTYWPKRNRRNLAWRELKLKSSKTWYREFEFANDICHLPTWSELLFVLQKDLHHPRLSKRSRWSLWLIQQLIQCHDLHHQLQWPIPVAYVLALPRAEHVRLYSGCSPPEYERQKYNELKFCSQDDWENIRTDRLIEWYWNVSIYQLEFLQLPKTQP